MKASRSCADWTGVIVAPASVGSIAGPAILRAAFWGMAGSPIGLGLGVFAVLHQQAGALFQQQPRQLSQVISLLPQPERRAGEPLEIVLLKVGGAPGEGLHRVEQLG